MRRMTTTTRTRTRTKTRTAWTTWHSRTKSRTATTTSLRRSRRGPSRTEQSGLVTNPNQAKKHLTSWHWQTRPRAPPRRRRKTCARAFTSPSTGPTTTRSTRRSSKSTTQPTWPSWCSRGRRGRSRGLSWSSTIRMCTSFNPMPYKRKPVASAFSSRTRHTATGFPHRSHTWK